MTLATAPATAELDVAVIATATERGGAERYLETLYSCLRPLGVRAHLVGDVPGADSWATTHVAAGVGAKWSRRGMWRSLARTPVERRRMLEATHQVQASAYHVQYKREQLLLTAPLAVCAPVIWTEHGRFPRGLRQRGLAALYGRASRHAAVVVCVSPAVQRDLHVMCGVDPARTMVIPNPVAVASMRPPTWGERVAARRSLGIPDDALVGATVGRLHPDKRIDLAIEAVRGVPDGWLLVVGDGPDRARLEALAGGAPVTLTGALQRPQAALIAADVFLLPSSAAAREGLPLSLIEAGALGLPAVIAGDADLDDLAAAGAARLAEPRSAAFATAWREVAGDSHAAARARAWAETCDAQRVAAVYADVIRGVVG